MLAKFRSKKVTLALVLVLVLALVAGGTYAWFTANTTPTEEPVPVGELGIDGGFLFDLPPDYYAEPGEVITSDTGVVENTGNLALFAKVTFSASTKFADGSERSPDPYILTSIDEASLESQVSASTGKLITWYKDIRPGYEGVYYVLMSPGTQYGGVPGVEEIDLKVDMLTHAADMGNEYMNAKVNFTSGWEATQAKPGAIQWKFDISLDPADGDIELIPAVTVPSGSSSDMNTILNEILGVDYYA